MIGPRMYNARASKWLQPCPLHNPPRLTTPASPLASIQTLKSLPHVGWTPFAVHSMWDAVVLAISHNRTLPSSPPERKVSG